MAQARGWQWDGANSRGSIWIDGVEAARFDDTGSYLTIPAGGVTITAGGLTVSAGGATITGGVTVATGDSANTAGNYRGGPINAFGTTEPTQAVVLDAGTAPAGAITESSGVFASTTVLRKIIADGTISNVG